eukprot:CAMPEP_0119328330 /NCGR_PEP_ID=MMETSP1333-20130426/73051_1 /TAXON_ID=418940 /ORGANISM="Scyphosphaera apsteinii, Strain RCC1455" /LENGTH=275 /DNA_ID=CAMNT_0007337145 /DNA_START=217 /DNA_END=1044 /DNA_ORIENTATION=-
MGGLWHNDTFVREQPRVRFRHEALVDGFGADASLHFAWSTSAPLNAALGRQFWPCELRAWSHDHNLDGRAELLQFLLRVPASRANGNIHAISLLVGLEVWADNSAHATLLLNGTAYVQHASPLPGVRWRQRARLGLHTAEPLPASSASSRSPCSHPFWAFEEPVGPGGHAVTAENILERMHLTCNDTVLLVTEPPLWSVGTLGADDSFELNLTISVPSLRLEYEPSVAEKLKNVLVQYMAFFIPFAVLLGIFRDAVIRHAVIATRMHNPLKPHRH